MYVYMFIYIRVPDESYTTIGFIILDAVAKTMLAPLHPEP